MIQQKMISKATLQGISKFFGARYTPKNSVRRGQALIEMAMVVIVLLFLTLGLIQYGLIANAKITLTNIAREGARYAALHGKDTDADDAASTAACLVAGNHIIRCRIRDVAAKTTLSNLDPNTDVTITPVQTARQKGSLVTVTVSYNLRNKLILPSGFPGLSGIGTTQVSGSMVLE